jgi:hypothetical protein
LRFEARAFLGERHRETLHQVGDETVGVLDSLARFVDERSLDLLPAPAESLRVLAGEERLSFGAGVDVVRLVDIVRFLDEVRGREAVVGAALVAARFTILDGNTVVGLGAVLFAHG